MKLSYSTWFVVGAAVCTMLADAKTCAAAESLQEKERNLIAVLQSDAPPQEKAITCKRLVTCASKEAVPSLAPLLLDEKLASWARITLEAIPDPAAGDALREAIGKVQGKLLVGVINSIGVRRDGKAAAPLIVKLQDADSEVASAAAEALGRIGGDQAAQALEKSLNRARGDFSRETLAKHTAIAYGCILCAEKYPAEGKSALAVRLYDSVRQAAVPKQRVLEATRGAILARKSEGIALLLEQLKSADKKAYAMGLRTARELPGRDVTQALLAELDRTSPERQNLLLRAVADRGDATVMPKLLELAKSSQTELRTTAIGLLDRFADASCVAVLLSAAVENDPELAKTAKSALARLGGKEVDAELLARLPQASGPTRRVLIELATARRIDGALPAVVKSAEDADESVCRAALEGIGVLGTEKEAADLIRLLGKAQSSKARDDLETALTSICSRSGAKCLPAVLPLAKTGSSDVRKIGLHALASIGGTEALNVVKSAINEQDEGVQNEAVSILSTWPNKWPEDSAVAEPLLALAKSGKKTSHQLQGLRGYLQYVQEDKKLSNDEKLAKIKELGALIQRPEEKRLTISVISSLSTAKGLEPLVTFAEDPIVAEEACLAIVKIADTRGKQDADLRRKALQTALEKSKNPNTRKKAEDSLKRLN